MSYNGYGHPTPPAGGDLNHGIALRDVTIVTFTIAVFMLILRFLARILIVKKTGLDDYVMALATVSATLQSAFILKCVASGGGRHQFYLSRQQRLDSIKWNTLSQMPLTVTNCLLKLSICFMIIRITNSRRLVKYMWALMAALVLVNGACFVDLLAQCRPIQALWDFTIQNACWSHKVLADLAWLQGIFSIVTDLICTSLPIIILWNIRITLNQKVAICGLMSLGLLTSACSIVRMVLYGTTKSFVDSSFTLTTLEIWSILEQNIGLIAANMPVMRPIYVFTREKTPSFYNSLKSIASGSIPSSRGATTTAGSNAGFSKLAGSKDRHPSEGSTEPCYYPPDDKTAMPLKTLPTTKTLNHSVFPFGKRRDGRGRDDWIGEDRVEDRV